jgi:succinoglycan biosynthesis transport protein ExoP
MVYSEDYIRELTIIFFVQKKIILGTTAIIAAIALLIVLFWPNTYAIKGKILVRAKKIEKNPELLEETSYRMFELTTEDLYSEVEILKSPDVIEKTVEYLHENKIMFEDVNFDAEAKQKLIGQIISKLDTNLIPSSNVIEVTLYDKNPERALILLQQIMKHYMLHRAGVFSPAEAIPYFEKNVDKFVDELNKEGKELTLLAKSSQAPDPKKEIEKNMALKQDMEKQINQIKSQIIEKNIYVANLKQTMESDDIQLFSFIENFSINKFSESLQALLVEKGNLLRVFHPDSSKARRITEQIETTYGLLKNEVNSYMNDQISQLNSFKNILNSLENRLIELNKNNINVYTNMLASGPIKRKYDVLNTSYDTFIRRLEEARISSSSDSNSLFSISVAAKPYYSGGPYFPNFSLIPFGILVGFIAGLSLGFLREFFDHTIKRPEDVSNTLKVPTLFSIPRAE